MRHIFCITIAALMLASTTVSCKKEKRQEEDIIVDRIVEKPHNTTERMPSYERTGEVTWVGGANYKYTITRQVDEALDVVTNHDQNYYDNSITLTVTRADGSEFFSKTFTKTNFAPAVPQSTLSSGVLLGMAFEKTNGNNLRFVVSIGSPDESYEEFYYVIMNLNNFGATSAEKYSTQDANDRQEEE